MPKMDWLKDAIDSRFHMTYEAMEKNRCMCASCEGRRLGAHIGAAQNKVDRRLVGLYGKVFDESLELNPGEESEHGSGFPRTHR